MKKGISLIVLVITIIVMIILAGTTLVNLTSNNPLEKANEAVFKNDLKQYSSELYLSASNYLLKNGFTDQDKIIINIYDDRSQIKKFIPSLRDSDADDITVLESKLVYSGADEQKQKWAQEIGIGLEGIERYYHELKVMQEAVKNAGKSNTIGMDLTDNPLIIRGITYSSGWYKIESSSEFEALSVNFSEIKYAPYIVRYSDGAVVNVAGKIINEKPVHSLNYNPGKESLALEGMMSAIDKDSEHSLTKWGEFNISSSNVGSYPISYEDGGLKLTSNSCVAELTVDQSRPINEKYSVNVTFKGDIYQGVDFVPGILAISDRIGEYLCWFGTYKGYLQVYTFRADPYSYLTKEKIDKGFASIDIKKYANTKMNVQITSEKSGKTCIYINGELAKKIDSGTANYSYKTLTIGDLRKGRGLKYQGIIYNFAIYSDILTEEQIKQNYEYSMK